MEGSGVGGGLIERGVLLQLVVAGGGLVRISLTEDTVSVDADAKGWATSQKH